MQQQIINQPTTVDRIKRETIRLSLVVVLREHPEWTLANLIRRMDRNDELAAVLRELTIQDLTTPPPIGPVTLQIAKRATGASFDKMVLAVVRRSKYPVKACYLRDRVGGPRWKLQDSLGRLVEAGEIERFGRTADTRYVARRDRA